MRRNWTIKQLKDAVKKSRSYRQVIIKLGLKPAGGNYKQIKKYISELNIDTGYFTGQGWNVGLRFKPKKKISLKKLLVKNNNFQSYKLKNRLFQEGLKKPQCEECGWAKKSIDGRIPLELNHKNGNSRDNRLKNLEVLCPNCHSLKPNHRGKNIKSSPGGGTGRRAALKML